MFKSMFAALATVAMLAASPVNAEESKLVRSISVSGHGEVRQAPDMAMISMGVITSAETAQAALDANSKSMRALFDILKQQGIEAKDISTSNFAVGPRYDYGRDGTQPPKVVGYDVNNMVTISVRDLAKLGQLLDSAVSAGSNQINGISFSVSKPSAMLDEARKLAIADARRKAEVYAAAGGFQLGNIISVSEGGGFQPPIPVNYKAARAEAMDAVPVAQGEQVLAIDVHVVWEIK